MIIATIVLGGITCGACGHTHTSVASVVECYDVLDDVTERRYEDRTFSEV